MNIPEERVVAYAAEMLSCIARLYNKEGTMLRAVSPDDDLDDRLLFTRELERTLLSPHMPNPCLASVNSTYFYASVRIDERICIVGPMRAVRRLSFRRNFTVTLFHETEAQLERKLPPLELSSCIDAICRFLRLLTGGDVLKITEAEIMRENLAPDSSDHNIFSEVTKTVFDNLETNTRHNPYDEEVREMAAVERGDVELLQRIVEEVYDGNVGMLASDSLRHTKNLGIVVITLAARAAIRGGVPYEVSFSLSDQFIQEIEKQTDSAQTEELFRSAEVNFARVVREYQRSLGPSRSEHSNYHIEKCKEYIFRHLHGRIRVPEIASALALNANYLSTFFRKCEGITISEYILRQKLVLVRNMLIYSDYTYLEITNYLGFPSQSYLGKKFKAETGMTLREYRTRYRAHDFTPLQNAAEFPKKESTLTREASPDQTS